MVHILQQQPLRLVVMEVIEIISVDIPSTVVAPLRGKEAAEGVHASYQDPPGHVP